MKIEIEIPDAAYAKLRKLAEISRGALTVEGRGALLLSRAITADHRIHFDPRRIEARKLKKITKLRAALESLGAPLVDGAPRPMAPESDVRVTERTADDAPLDAETLADLDAAAEDATADVKPAKGFTPPKGPAKPKAKKTAEKKAA
jgi:hypothetical protein